LCANDTNRTVALSDILANEKIERAIKSEFAKGIRNISLSLSQPADILITTYNEIHTFHASKHDYADLLELAEEDARRNKRIKKGCEGIELVDIVTVD
jgi:hypothetical protein